VAEESVVIGGGTKTTVEGALSGLGGATLFVIKKKILLDWAV
jgi:hypothetical protein